MIIQKKCIKCNSNHSIEVTEYQSIRLFNRDKTREFIQDILPTSEYTSEQRELFLSGMCNECWDKLFPKEDKD